MGLYHNSSGRKLDHKGMSKQGEDRKRERESGERCRRKVR